MWGLVTQDNTSIYKTVSSFKKIRPLKAWQFPIGSVNTNSRNLVTGEDP